MKRGLRDKRGLEQERVDDVGWVEEDERVADRSPSLVPRSKSCEWWVERVVQVPDVRAVDVDVEAILKVFCRSPKDSVPT